jgi:hypothetical protein
MRQCLLCPFHLIPVASDLEPVTIRSVTAYTTDIESNTSRYPN